MAIDSLGPQCRPSYEMQAGNEKETPVLLNLLAAGWAVVVPDFEGPRDAYGAGMVAAHVTLDGLRAAERLPAAGLSANTPVGMWGYSGGGQATAWAAEQQASYAPELKVAGIAEGGVPADVERVLRNLDGGPGFGIYFAASVGTAREYPEMGFDALLNDAGRGLRDTIGTQCAEQLIFGYPNHHMSEYTNVPDALAVPSVRSVLAADDLGQKSPTAPVFIFHSVADELIPVAGPDALVKKYCAAGARVFYQRDARGEHIGYAFTGGVDAFGYLAERFASGPVATNCGLLPWTG
jgi:dienelactone hydrolase